MLLTIGMIVKNEEKYLERCLNGIKPILEQVDSELIIADTGSTDRTVEIARQFTDNVFYFEWIKDFAAARNSTLEKAQGEWYMFVDADEIFESCDEIIHFFNSGEYKKYNSASYVVRNILSSSKTPGETTGSRFADFSPPRMTKILRDTTFINPVHENLSTYGPPIKSLQDMVLHYGYSYDEDSEEKKLKEQRNIELLEKRLETEEKSSMLYLQLYESYCGADDTKADEYLELGLEFSRKKKNGFVPIFISKKLAGYYGEGKYEECLPLIEEYFALDKKMRPGIITTDVDVMACHALCLNKIGEHEKAISRFIRFFELQKNYTSGKLLTEEANTTLRDFARKDNFIPILNQFAISCIKTNRYDTANEWLKKLPVGKYSDIPAQLYDLAKVSLIIGEYNDYKDIGEYYSHYNEKGKKAFFEAIRDKFFEGIKISELVQAVESFAVSEPELLGRQRLYIAVFSEKEITASDVLKITENYNIKDYPELLYFVIKYSLDISMLLSVKDFDAKRALQFCYANIRSFDTAMDNYSVNYIGETQMLSEMAEFMANALRMALVVRRKGVFFARNIDKLFENYADISARFCADMGLTDKDSVPVHIRPCIIASQIVASRKAGDYKTCIAKMREIIEFYPELTPIIAEYRKGVIREYESAQPQTEMQKLSVMIKSNIRNYIASGNIEAAEKTLAEYEKINPSDPDIAVLKAEIQ